MKDRINKIIFLKFECIYTNSIKLIWKKEISTLNEITNQKF